MCGKPNTFRYELNKVNWWWFFWLTDFALNPPVSKWGRKLFSILTHSGKGKKKWRLKRGVTIRIFHGMNQQLLFSLQHLWWVNINNGPEIVWQKELHVRVEHVKVIKNLNPQFTNTLDLHWTRHLAPCARCNQGWTWNIEAPFKARRLLRRQERWNIWNFLRQNIWPRCWKSFPPLPRGAICKFPTTNVQSCP